VLVAKFGPRVIEITTICSDCLHASELDKVLKKGFCGKAVNVDSAVKALPHLLTYPPRSFWVDYKEADVLYVNPGAKIHPQPESGWGIVLILRDCSRKPSEQ
jgi:hypothetical protein